MITYDILCIGHMSIDIIRTPDSERTETGGAILHAAWTAHKLGANSCILTKTSQKEKWRLSEFPDNNIKINWIESQKTTSILNEYSTIDKEKRKCTNLGKADSFSIHEIPEIKTNLVIYNGLIAGEINLAFIQKLASIGKVAVDAQGLIRKVMPTGEMQFQMWENLREALPNIYYFKVDAAEAEFITGISTSTREGRINAAKLLIKWGVAECIVSHNQELLIVTNAVIHSVAFKNRSLEGRTGRGDTCTTSYILERQSKSISESAKFAAALTSLKMETPGPFKNSRKEVEEFIKEFYR
ncbi:PfkB family carbohydrate kinase [Candidatus Lokiarchaeum ossiferum]|uniref:PfkB family carbohydrate kinase n=1 Tax=Candidatus Lokiarchaeum ossiferum TaxID=2951803 RepID=UPI00352DD8EC